MSSDQSSGSDATPDSTRPGPADKGRILPASAGPTEAAPDVAPADGDQRSRGLAGRLLLYTLLRVGLIVGLTALLALFMPLIVALLFAIIVQLPLAWLLFDGQRRRVNDAMAAASAHRRAERERLRAALAGEDTNPGQERG